MKHALATALWLALGGVLGAQTAPAAAELSALLREFLGGASRNDPSVHERFWADDLIYTGSAGRRISKADILADVKNAPATQPAEPQTVFSAEDVRIQQYGDSAIVAFRLVGTTRAGTAPAEVAHYLNTGTFVRRKGRWQAVAWQATRMPAQSEAPQAAATPGAPAPGVSQEGPAGPPELLERRVVLELPGMERARVRRGLRYPSGDATLGFEAYLPEREAPPGGWPFVVLVHGGPIPKGARPKEWGVFRSYGELLAASGLAAVAFDHRLNDASDYPRAASDVLALLAHVRGRAGELQLDPGRVAVWAFSGGGPLLAAVLAERPAWLKAGVSYYAYLGAPKGTPPDARLQALEQLRAGGTLPALLVARAGQDDPGLNAAADEFTRAAVERGVALELLTHPQGRHGFDIFDDDARSRAVIRATLQFLQGELAAE